MIFLSLQIEEHMQKCTWIFKVLWVYSSNINMIQVPNFRDLRKGLDFCIHGCILCGMFYRHKLVRVINKEFYSKTRQYCDYYYYYGGGIGRAFARQKFAVRQCVMTSPAGTLAPCLLWRSLPPPPSFRAAAGVRLELESRLCRVTARSPKLFQVCAAPQRRTQCFICVFDAWECPGNGDRRR